MKAEAVILSMLIVSIALTLSACTPQDIAETDIHTKYVLFTYTTQQQEPPQMIETFSTAEKTEIINPYFSVQNSTGEIFRVDHGGNFYLYPLTNCDTLDTDENGLLSCGTDADTTYTNSSFDLSQLANTGDINIGDHNFTVGTTLFINSLYNTIAMGGFTTATGDYSTAMGYNTKASGDKSIAIGRGIEAGGVNSVAIALNDQNGVNVSQANTMAIMGGNVGIGTVSPAQKLDVIGNINVSGFVNATGFYDDGVLLVDTDTNLTEQDITNMGFTKDTNTDTQDLSYDTGTDVISLTDGGSIDITEVDTDTNTNCSVTNSCPSIAYDNEINKSYVDTQDSAQDACSEITGCVENAITDGNTNWGNDYNLLDKDTDSYCSDAGCGTDDQTCAEVSGCVEGATTNTGTVTSITTTAPISGGTITTTGTISLSTATPSDGDTTHASTADQIFDYIVSLVYTTKTYVDTLIGSIGNWTADKGDYSTKAQADALYADISVVDTDTNLTEQDIIDFGFTKDTNTDTQDLSYDTGTDVISLTDGGSIDITEVDTDTHLTEDNVESYIFDSDNTANLDMNGYNITVSNIIMEVDQANHKIYDNETCIIMKAGTTYLEVCE